MAHPSHLPFALRAQSVSFLKNVFCYLFICAVLGLCCCVGFSLGAASGGYSICGAVRSLRWPLSLQSAVSRKWGFP